MRKWVTRPDCTQPWYLFGLALQLSWLSNSWDRLGSLAMVWMNLRLFTYYLLIWTALLYKVITEPCHSWKEQRICVMLIVKSVHVLEELGNKFNFHASVAQLISKWLNYQVGPLVFTGVTWTYHCFNSKCVVATYTCVCCFLQYLVCA